MDSTKFKTVEQYLDTLPANVREAVEELRIIIKRAAPQATEVISYNMPAIKMNKVLVYYAAHKEHIGFYPTAAPMIVFKDELKGYKTSKGAIQFPAGKPIPKALVRKIVKYRLAEDVEKAKAKSKAR